MADNTLTTTITETPSVQLTPRQKRAMVITESGDIHISQLSPTEIDKAREITRNLSSKVIGSASTYGAEVSNQLMSSNKTMLDQSAFKGNTEIDTIAKNVRNQLCGLNVSDLGAEPNMLLKFLQKIPVIGSMIKTPLQKMIIDCESRVKTIEAIETTVKDIEVQSNASNQKLEVMFQQNIQLIRQLENLVIAGYVKIEDAKNELAEMEKPENGFSEIEINDQRNFISDLNNQLYDLMLVRQASKNQLMQLRIAQRNNIDQVSNARKVITFTLPMFVQQVSLAQELERQKLGNTALAEIKEGTNQSIVTVAEMLKQNTIEARKFAMDGAVDAQKLQEASQKLKETIEAVNKLEEERVKKQQDNLKLLSQLDKTMEQMQQNNHLLSVKIDTTSFNDGKHLLDGE